MPSDPSLPISDALAIVRDHVADQSLLKAITDDLLKAQREIAAEKEAAKEENASGRNKNRFVVMIRGDAALKAQVAGGAFIIAVPDGEDQDVQTYSGDQLLQRFYKGVRVYNEAPRGKRGKARTKVESIVDAFRLVKAKVWKDAETGIKVKTASPVEVIVLEHQSIDEVPV